MFFDEYHNTFSWQNKKNTILGCSILSWAMLSLCVSSFIPCSHTGGEGEKVHIVFGADPIKVEPYLTNMCPQDTVNVLKFWTFYSIPFWPKFCVLCSFFFFLSKYQWNGKQCRPWSDCSGAVWSGSALFAYAILSDTLVFKILGHLPYMLTNWLYFSYFSQKIGFDISWKDKSCFLGKVRKMFQNFICCKFYPAC